MYSELREAALVAGEAGSSVLLRYFRADHLEIEKKAEHDYVTQADRDSETAILGVLRERFPDHSILSEESGVVSDQGSGYNWVVDPLDGTTNFLRGLPVWGISIACLDGNEPVAGAILDPIGGNVYSAARGGGADWNGESIRVSDRTGMDGSFLATGYPFRARAALDVYLELFRRIFLRAGSIRRCGAAALDLAHTAIGVYDGFFEFRLSAWDIAAGALLIEEAGGSVSDLDGGRTHLTSGNLVAGAPQVAADLLDIIRDVASETILEDLVPLDSL